MGNNGKSWHKDVIPEAAESILEVLLKNDLASFYLAGGTGLALQLGHRLSRDLDFFSAQSFDEEKMLNDLKHIEKLSVVSMGRETLHLHISGIKVSFLGKMLSPIFWDQVVEFFRQEAPKLI